MSDSHISNPSFLDIVAAYKGGLHLSERKKRLQNRSSELLPRLRTFYFSVNRPVHILNKEITENFSAVALDYLEKTIELENALKPHLSPSDKEAIQEFAKKNPDRFMAMKKIEELERTTRKYMLSDREFRQRLYTDKELLKDYWRAQKPQKLHQFEDEQWMFLLDKMLEGDFERTDLKAWNDKWDQLGEQIQRGDFDDDRPWLRDLYNSMTDSPPDGWNRWTFVQKNGWVPNEQHSSRFQENDFAPEGWQKWSMGLQAEGLMNHYYNQFRPNTNDNSAYGITLREAVAINMICRLLGSSLTRREKRQLRKDLHTIDIKDNYIFSFTRMFRGLQKRQKRLKTRSGKKHSTQALKLITNGRYNLNQSLFPLSMNRWQAKAYINGLWKDEKFLSGIAKTTLRKESFLDLEKTPVRIR